MRPQSRSSNTSVSDAVIRGCHGRKSGPSFARSARVRVGIRRRKSPNWGGEQMIDDSYRGNLELKFKAVWIEIDRLKKQNDKLRKQLRDAKVSGFQDQLTRLDERLKTLDETVGLIQSTLAMFAVETLEIECLRRLDKYPASAKRTKVKGELRRSAAVAQTNLITAKNPIQAWVRLRTRWAKYLSEQGYPLFVGQDISLDFPQETE